MRRHRPHLGNLSDHCKHRFYGFLHAAFLTLLLNYRTSNLNLYLISQKADCFIKTSCLTSKMPFDLSKITFDLLKPQFAYSFWCFPQVKWTLTYSNPSLLTHFGVFCKQNELWLIQNQVWLPKFAFYLLILVFSASRIRFNFLNWLIYLFI